MSFFDRKSRYSIHSLITCDPRRKIIHVALGWPGATHDARVLASVSYMTADKEGKSHHFYTGDQYGVGDAAFGASRRLVPTYKVPLSSFIENQIFNTLQGSLRVRSEHVNGMVKVRFQGLREVRLRLDEDEDMEEIVQFICAGYVMHNILLDLTDTFWDNYDSGSNSSISTAGLEFDSNCGVEEDTLLSEKDGGTEFRERFKEYVLRAHNIPF